MLHIGSTFTNVLSQSGGEFVSRATNRVEQYYQHWGWMLDCVVVGSSLRPGEKLSWQCVTRLFSPVCLSVRQIRAELDAGLWLSSVRSWEPVASHLLSLCGCKTGGALFTSPSAVWDDFSVMAMSTVNDFTLHMRCWLAPLVSNRLTLSYSPLWLVNWSPAPCWHSDPNGGELMLSRHALTSLLPPSQV